MRFTYSTTDPSQDAFDSLPRLPLRLRADSRAIDVMGLVDSGATVNVLPYEVGLQLGMGVFFSQRRLQPWFSSPLASPVLSSGSSSGDESQGCPSLGHL